MTGSLQEKNGFSDKDIVRALAVAGLIGQLVATNASVSGAECGCQAEIGTACSMAAAALAELFEMGIPVTYGSDCHHSYKPLHINTEKYLLDAGFVDGDISAIAEYDLW